MKMLQFLFNNAQYPNVCYHIQYIDKKIMYTQTYSVLTEKKIEISLSI